MENSQANIGNDQITADVGSSAHNAAIGKGIRQNVREDIITINNGDSVLNYTLADLRIDIRFQKQEIDRLRDDLNRDRQADATITNRLVERLDSMQENLNFLDEQVKGMLLLKPVPSTTPTVSINAFYAFLTVIGAFVILVTIMLMLLARGH